MDFFNMQNLALGGLAAAVIGFWGQVKNVLRYISSAVVVQASLDSSLSYAVTIYAKNGWKQFPTGIQMFRTVYLLMKDGSWKHVPYKSITQNMLFFKGWRFFYVKLSQDGDAKLVYLRGFVTAEELIISGLLDQVNKGSDVKVDRFAVIPVMGQEKGSWAMGGMSNRGGGNESSSDAPIASTLKSSGFGNVFTPDHNTDESFMYPKSELQLNTEQNPLKGLFYDDHTLKHLNDAMLWHSAEKWYAERSIPWKRGWLIHGPGGTGKSSLALATAKKMQVPIYQYMLSTLSDQEFISQWQRMMVPCVALFEDFDTVFDKREPLTEHKSLTFDCVLNQISGVKTLSGVFLIVTTNHIDKIDEAMGVVSDAGSISTRPGRIDHVIYLGPASLNQKLQMVNHILKDWPDAHEELINDSKDYTAVQFQEKCISYAFSRMSQAKADHDVAIAKIPSEV